MGVVQYNPYGLLETRGPAENRVMNSSNGSLIAVRRAAPRRAAPPVLLWAVAADGLRRASCLSKPVLARRSCVHTRTCTSRLANAAALLPPSCRSYEARAAGVKRNMRGDQARAACPTIQLVQASRGPGLSCWEGAQVAAARGGWPPCRLPAHLLPPPARLRTAPPRGHPWAASRAGAHRARQGRPDAVPRRGEESAGHSVPPGHDRAGLHR